jgi:RNA polymerase sigma-70 factor (ECF subfamily)
MESQATEAGTEDAADTETEPEVEIVKAIRAVLAGDVQAYGTIVTRFQASMMTLCAAILGNRQAAEELAGDVFVRAYQRLDSFDLRRPMKPWLSAIACRLAQERWRGEARERHRREAASAMRDSKPEEGPSDRLRKLEQSDILWRVVRALPMAQRTAVVLYYRENLSVDDVARVMGTSAGTVKTHLFRARAELKEKLRGCGFDEDDLS